MRICPRFLVFLLLLNQQCVGFLIRNIGIFSMCLGKSNRTSSHHVAESLKNTYFDAEKSFIWSLYTGEQPPYLLTKHIEFDVFDVCEGMAELKKVVIDLLLSKKYQLQEGGHQSVHHSSIMAVFSYLPNKMNTLLRDVMYEQVVYDISLISEQLELSQTDLDLESDVQLLSDVISYFQWEDLTLLYIGIVGEEHPYHPYFVKTLETFKTFKLCVSHYEISPYEIDKFITKKWLQNMRGSAIILFGVDKYLTVALDFFGYFYQEIKFPLLVLDAENFDAYYKATFIKIFDHLRHDIRGDYLGVRKRLPVDVQARIQAYPNHINHKLTLILWNFYSTLSRLRRYRNRLKSDYRDFFRIRIRMRELYQSGIIQGKTIIKIKHDVYDRRFAVDIDSQDRYQDHADIQNSSCPILNCPPGLYKNYQNVSNQFTWLCKPCPSNTIKPDYGNTACTKCTGLLSIDNGNRTKCIDPYSNISPVALASSEFIFLITFCALGFIFSSFNLFIFTVKRNSPIVKLSDYNVSIIHNILSCWIFTTVLLAFFAKPQLVICRIKPLIITILYTINIGIVFIKSQKILQAFSSRVKITAGEARKTIVLQIFTVFIFVVIMNTIFAVTAFHKHIRLVFQENAETLHRTHFCNTSSHMTIVIATLTFIQLMCSIQAFRARKLSSIMNDSLVLVYTTFSITIIFGVSFVIVYFQKHIDKDLFQYTAIVLNTFVINSLLYGLKCIRMLSYPKQNTTEYFREQRARNVANRFGN
ncbi:uncharacterized protein [Clytia hemisphaerica]|uniref:uncharacterized protein n=1 Tax=Clytia hemisphaerica TaxID=252671 RepID=UPI0034D7B8C9